MTPSSKEDKTRQQDLLHPHPHLGTGEEKTADYFRIPNGHESNLVLSARMDRIWFLPVWNNPLFWKIPPEVAPSPSPMNAVSLAIINREGGRIAELRGIVRDLHPNGGETISPHRGVSLSQIHGILRMEAYSLHLIRGMGLEIQVEEESELKRGGPNRVQLALHHPELGPVFRGQGFIKKMERSR